MRAARLVIGAVLDIRAEDHVAGGDDPNLRADGQRADQVAFALQDRFAGVARRLPLRVGGLQGRPPTGTGAANRPELSFLDFQEVGGERVPDFGRVVGVLEPGKRPVDLVLAEHGEPDRDGHSSRTLCAT